MSPHPLRRRQGGFTLVEILVAFTILALVLLAAFGGTSTSLLLEHRAEFSRKASLLARSKLEQLGLSEPIKVGATAGTGEGGLTWRLSVTPDRMPPGPSSLAGYWVTVTVLGTGPQNRTERLAVTTLKLGPVNP